MMNGRNLESGRALDSVDGVSQAHSCLILELTVYRPVFLHCCVSQSSISH